MPVHIGVGVNISGYSIEVTTEGDTWIRRSQVDGNSTTTTVIEDLRAHTLYMISVKPRYGTKIYFRQHGENSNIRVKTYTASLREMTLPNPPSGLIAAKIGPDTISLTWDAANLCDSNITVEGYDIEYFMINSNTTVRVSGLSPKRMTISNPSVEIKFLRAGANYKVYVHV